MTTDDSIKALVEILEEQQKLSILALFLKMKGPATYKGEMLSCSLSEAQKKVAGLISLGGGQSANTILKLTSQEGIPVRDQYPIARCALEAFINAAYVISQGDEVATRALRHVEYATFRETNRTIGSGEMSMTLKSMPELPPTFMERFKEFEGKGKGKGNWTSLDAHSRINKVANLNCKAAARLLGGYALIYSISSEIIHGGPSGDVVY